jgi:4-hydroxy-tetrahydrodipicolinate synthase
MSNETIARLAQVPGVVGVKDATGNIARVADLLRRVPGEFVLISGDDPTAAALILLGGRGNISVTANVAPKLMHEMCAAAFAGDLTAARAANRKLLRLHLDLFIEANPIPVKWAVAQMGLIGEGLRLPLTPLSDRYHQTVREAMSEAGIDVAISV